VKAGVNPVAPDRMYLFVTEDRPNNDRLASEDFLPLLQNMLIPFTAPVMVQMRAQLNEGSQIVYRPLEWLLAPRPWGRGRIVLIGDAAHATTPQLASGARIGVEDGIVLAQTLAEKESVEAARCRRRGGRSGISSPKSFFRPSRPPPSRRWPSRPTNWAKAGAMGACICASASIATASASARPRAPRWRSASPS
jgi:hypothetical protein